MSAGKGVIRASQHNHSFERVIRLEILRKAYGYRVAAGRVDAVLLAGVSNFEFRADEGAPFSITHMYIGNETGRDADAAIIISFESPCEVRMSHAGPRCHVYVSSSSGEKSRL